MQLNELELIDVLLIFWFWCHRMSPELLIGSILWMCQQQFERDWVRKDVLLNEFCVQSLYCEEQDEMWLNQCYILKKTILSKQLFYVLWFIIPNVDDTLWNVINITKLQLECLSCKKLLLSGFQCPHNFKMKCISCERVIYNLTLLNKDMTWSDI